ncbi:hypothetical protein GS682_26765 [Nostoc sp. B(2019)]|nr:hypothetical protein [Nostoc sp. B(2019)]
MYSTDDYFYWHSSSVLHTNKGRETKFLFLQLLHSEVYSRYVAANVSFADLPSSRAIAFDLNQDFACLRCPLMRLIN